jgi:hypothetical protein
MTLEEAIALLNESLEKLNKVFENKNELLHWHEDFSGNLETAMTLVENCISDLTTDDGE